MPKSPGSTQVTDAEDSHEADIRSRTSRYLLSMSIRIVCFFLAFVCTGPLRWVFAAGAIVLPWIAVLIANARSNRFDRERRVPAPTRVDQPLPARPARADSEPEVVVGEVIEPGRQLPRGTEDGRG
ncbi:DUF3099 domain-containing protein [Brevibacterium sp. 5221]|uniref:DUF3099 domain-containing protein n=1 Tax=Brevibacterium rongguiense TaxID=2695267 RepID=A0A6N9H4V9_9MICO|nr:MULTISPECIES: DUF3099 domain-containing protein [Brevibacterium]MYM18975.1 DUF3099 domain-containing protein [Brevibacterium rongguiense]WAL40823.1 DUF3099 domain-containing protein [Brevibacterium sp. BRM-1]